MDGHFTHEYDNAGRKLYGGDRVKARTCFKDEVTGTIVFDGRVWFIDADEGSINPDLWLCDSVEKIGSWKDEQD